MSQRAYAKHRGVSHVAVQRAVKSGRLGAAVVNGKIADAELADRLWAQNTDYTDAPASVLAQAARNAGTVNAEDEEDSDGSSKDPSIVEANRREKWAKAKLAELKLAREAGNLVSVDEITARFGALITGIRNKLLGVPSRVRQQVELPLSTIALIESLIREALEDVADATDEADE